MFQLLQKAQLPEALIAQTKQVIHKSDQQSSELQSETREMRAAHLTLHFQRQLLEVKCTQCRLQFVPLLNHDTACSYHPGL